MAELDQTFILEQPISPTSSLHCIVDRRHPDGCIGFASPSSGVTWFYDRNLNQVGGYEISIQSTIGPVELIVGVWALIRIGVTAATGAAIRATARNASVALGIRIAVSMGPAVERMRMLYLTFAVGAGATVRGPLGQVATQTLDRIVTRANGPYIQLVTNLTQRPEIGRALSTATGNASQTLATAARTGGRMYQAKVPAQLVAELERIGLATRSITRMGSSTGIEIRFEAAASRWIAPFFH